MKSEVLTENQRMLIERKNITNKTSIFRGGKKLLNAVSRLECPLLACKYKIRFLLNQKDLNINPKSAFTKINKKKIGKLIPISRMFLIYLINHVFDQNIKGPKSPNIQISYIRKQSAPNHTLADSRILTR